MTVETTLGADFAHAIAAKDADRLGALLHPDVDFRGLTPKRTWEANSPAEVLDVVFGHWFEPEDDIEALEHVETGTLADRERVGYRMRIMTPEGPHVVEQQAYLSSEEGRITWARIVCSGFRPAG